MTGTHTYIALLRGINVSGHRKIRMAGLRELCSGLSFSNVRSYIQSGNLVFTASERSPEKVAHALSSGIKSEYGFDVAVIVRRPADLSRLVKQNPFAGSRNPDRVTVTFLGRVPSPERKKALIGLSFPPEEFVLKGDHVYLYLPLGSAKAKLGNNLFENKLNVEATSRNWRTVCKLKDMAGEPTS